MSILSKIFGGGHVNAANAANKYLNQIPDVAHKGYDPYIQQGQAVDTHLNDLYAQLVNDPTGFIDKIMQNYKTSEGYGFQKDALTKELGATAAAGGIRGTPLDQMNQGQAIQGLLSKDQQQYLQNALGAFNQGVGGEQGVSSRGYNATGALTDILGGALNQQGGLAFNNAQQKNQNSSQIFQTLLQALGTIGGGFAGGPGGAAAGGAFANWLMPKQG